jgi:hypothetical protein
MSFLHILALTEQVYQYVQPYWEYLKKEVRNFLGPEPISYLLLEDGNVIPSSFKLPNEMRPSSFVYHPLTRQILRLDILGEGRLKPLPYLGIVFKSPTQEVDISEWVGNIRAYPVPAFLTAKQLLGLWSNVHAQHLFGKDASIHIVKEDGSEETLAFSS